MDTIFALATASGRAGIAVIRVSGPNAVAAAQVLAGHVPKPRRASLRLLTDADGQRIDEALVLYFPKGESFTGEDVVEFQCHGSPAIQRHLLACLSKIEGCRLAEAGEFTRRAFENGQMDLAQVEGLGALIEAETEAQRRQAERLLTGSLRASVEEWRADLLRATALLEAMIDFADEEVPYDTSPEVAALVAQLIGRLENEARGAVIAERVRGGFEVVLLGRPNSGKSTLINAIAGREAAITSDIPGTTRDFVEVFCDLNGLPVTFVDSAGLRESSDHIESIGIARTRDRARSADIRVWLGVPDEAIGADDIIVSPKCDINGVEGALPISGKTGFGLTDLLSEIERRLEGQVSLVGSATHARHAERMRDAVSCLREAEVELGQGPDRAEFTAEQLRLAGRSLDRLIGQIGVEDVLGEIFSSFCIGK